MQEFRLEIMVRFKGKPCRSREVDQLKIYFGHRTNRTFDELDMGDERQELRMIRRFQALATGRC